MSALKTQAGGTHYKKHRIQPIEFSMANDLNFCQANVVKYIVRYKDKGGLEDLRKAAHYIDLLIELEYGEDPIEETDAEGPACYFGGEELRAPARVLRLGSPFWAGISLPSFDERHTTSGSANKGFL